MPPRLGSHFWEMQSKSFIIFKWIGWNLKAKSSAELHQQIFNSKPQCWRCKLGMCWGKKLGLVLQKKTQNKHVKSSRRLQPAGTGVWIWQQHHCHEHRVTLTGESLGWAGSQKFSAGSLSALVSARDTKHIPHQHFTSKVSIFLVMFLIRELHWSTPSKVPLCYQRCSSS